MSHLYKIPTAHIAAKHKDEIADTVLMPGDPLRATLIAEKFLDNPVLFTSIRNIVGYTGTYKGKKISVMASGMGMPSIGIYSYELFKFYDVENIIRIGSCGSYTDDIKLFDLILCTDAYSESSYAKVQSNTTEHILKASNILNNKIEQASQKNNIPITKGRIHSSDVFYSNDIENYKTIFEKYNCIGVEMEAFGLFANAQLLNKKAATLLTVTDHLNTGLTLTADQRQNALTNMITIALESIL